jgi:hypothetical protein
MLLVAKTANDPELIKQLAPGILRLTGATPELAGACGSLSLAGFKAHPGCLFFR